jgi:hypothetical protein
VPYNNPFTGGFAAGGPTAYGTPKSAYANPFMDPSIYKDIYDPANPTKDNRAILDADNGAPGWGLFRQNYGGNAQFQEWLGQQQTRQRQQYLGQAALDPTLQWFDYLKKYNAAQEYANQSPFARGDAVGSYASPLVRYTPAR